MGTDLLCAYLDRIQAEVEGLHSELAQPGLLTLDLRLEMADHMIALTAELTKARATASRAHQKRATDVQS